MVTKALLRMMVVNNPLTRPYFLEGGIGGGGGVPFDSYD